MTTTVAPTTTPLATGAQARAAQPAVDDSAAKLATDFDTFLKLLTTQLKNQDPSKPFDSTEFVGQLASFSSVEQQISTNAKLDGLIAAITGDATLSLASWVGRSVLSDAPADFAGNPVPVHYALPRDTTSASILVTDATGQLVDRIPVMPGTTEAAWDGLALDGSPMPHGRYTFSVETFEGTTPTGTIPAQTFSQVVEARIADGTPHVVFGDGSRLAVDQITAVRGGA